MLSMELLKTLFILVFSLICEISISQTLLFQNIDTIYTKHFYNTPIIKNQSIYKVSIDSFIYRSEIVKAKTKEFFIEFTFKVNGSGMSIYLSPTEKVVWQILSKVENTSTQVYPKDFIKRVGNFNDSLDVLKYYEYSFYGKNKFASFLASTYTSKAKRNYGVIQTILNDSIFLLEEAQTKTEWKYSKHKGGYCLKRVKENLIIEEGEAENLILFNGYRISKRYRDEIIIPENIYRNDSVKIYDKTTEKEEKIYLQTDVEPEFLGGKRELQKQIQKNMVYLNVNYANYGRIYIRFVITKYGEVKYVQVIRGIAPILDESAYFTVSKLPSFKPGLINGKPVNAWYIVPVDYVLH